MTEDDRVLELSELTNASAPWAKADPIHEDDASESWPNFGTATKRSIEEQSLASDFVRAEMSKVTASGSLCELIFTDGSSADDSKGMGGAGAVFCNGKGEVTETLAVPLGNAISSFCAELV